jgi:hypothetical protein
MIICRTCGCTNEEKTGQWWGLSNYYGFSGRFCPDCYDKVSHNSYGQPNNPKDYLFMVLKFGTC